MTGLSAVPHSSFGDGQTHTHTHPCSPWWTSCLHSFDPPGDTIHPYILFLPCLSLLSDTGSVFAFGENKMGQLGLGNQTDAVPSPAQVPAGSRAVGLGFSGLRSAALPAEVWRRETVFVSAQEWASGALFSLQTLQTCLAPEASVG